jgi:hypothetical protein
MQLEKLTDLYFKLFPQTGYHVLANDLLLGSKRLVQATFSNTIVQRIAGYLV